jgi:2-polyprenyl-6-methoxyphenol hydroxylase-like FAD-dependent oxidoreductase
MSPAGGVGINLALQDAVATANLLARKLRDGPVSLTDLDQVQERREWPVRLIQTMQVFIHRRIVSGRAGSGANDSLPLIGRLFRWFPLLRRLPARFIGLGPRPEHIHSPAVF